MLQILQPTPQSQRKFWNNDNVLKVNFGGVKDKKIVKI